MWGAEAQLRCKNAELMNNQSRNIHTGPTLNITTVQKYHQN